MWERSEASASCREGQRCVVAVVVPVSVKKKFLRIRMQVGKSALKTPNLGQDCSFGCWVAWPRLP